MRAKRHPTEKPRGVRDPRGCQVQTGGHLVWIRTAPGVPGLQQQAEVWVDRPYKFPGHVRTLLKRPAGVVLEDVKWRQLGSTTWWRLPEWPTGRAEG